MSHEVEKMMFVGATPWHGLGTKLDSPPTIQEAIVAAGLDWTVSTHQLYYKNPLDTAKDRVELKTTPSKAVIRDTDAQYLGTVGKNWTPLQNIDAFEFFQPFLDEGLVTLETAGSLRKGRHIWILAKIKGDPLVIAGDDTVQRYMLLANGHGGVLAATAALTPVRTVCANTLAMALESGDTKMLRVVHTAKVKENLALVQETINLANNRFEANAELYRDLAGRAINKNDLELYIKRVFVGDRKLAAFKERHEEALLQKMEDQLAEMGLGNEPGRRIVEKIVPIFEKGRGNDLPGVKGTWWAAYNSVSEYLSHERGTSQDIRVDSMWFGQNAVTNRKSLELAKDMAFS